MANTASTVYLKDYQPSAFEIDKVFLHFELADNQTVVSSRLLMRKKRDEALVLNGVDLTLLKLCIDGKELKSEEYHRDNESLTIPNLPESFELQCVTQIEPEKNTSLEGLYRSNGMFCTQCEAEGFRKITYYLDRPDVMSEFETTIVAESGAFKTMLSNGNCISDTTTQGKRTVVWHDPFKKPCYLFALVAGNLASVEDSFITLSNRRIKLQIFVEDKDLNKCDHAMLSLKNAMRWDEEVYGREYDLDIFMIVAVDDFNMGAMENKGLNIFNTSCVLAHPETTTDVGFERVEAVVAHEYFHNWSGNRVTCRDWFQLSLKEGFTVYRDAEFSADMNSAVVKRIEDVSLLRSAQFPEDAGPMAHCIRPASFIEISNFYTVTIYEKGAEVVRMLANILGKKLFRQATDLYFERFDGQAVTCEDFVVCMEEASGKDLSQFRYWYSQAGTPQLKVSDKFDAEKQQYTLMIEQHTPATPECSDKEPFHIPLQLALYGEAGAFALTLNDEIDQLETEDNTERVLDVTKTAQEFVFDNISEKPIPSLLRNFSAPVKLEYNYSSAELAKLMKVDSDGFCRWDAGQKLMVIILQKRLKNEDADNDMRMLLASLSFALSEEGIDKAMLSQMLTLPSEAYLAELVEIVDPIAIHQVSKQLKCEMARHLEQSLLDCYSIEAVDSASRSLRNTALMLLMQLDNTAYVELAYVQFEQAQNMTDELAALKSLVNSIYAQAQSAEAIVKFYNKWRHESLVVNMWLQIQASADQSDALATVKSLLTHESFDSNNPNKLRALIAGFCMQNLVHFHTESGEGYEFLADQVIALNVTNPQIAARLLTPLTRWAKFSEHRSSLMIEQLHRILKHDCSKDVYEVVTKSLPK